MKWQIFLDIFHVEKHLVLLCIFHVYSKWQISMEVLRNEGWDIIVMPVFSVGFERNVMQLYLNACQKTPRTVRYFSCRFGKKNDLFLGSKQNVPQFLKCIFKYKKAQFPSVQNFPHNNLNFAGKSFHNSSLFPPCFYGLNILFFLNVSMLLKLKKGKQGLHVVRARGTLAFGTPSLVLHMGHTIACLVQCIVIPCLVRCIWLLKTSSCVIRQTLNDFPF